MVAFSRIAVALLVYLLSLTAAAQEKPKIYLGASSKTLGYSPLWVAEKKGFFDQQGLDVQLVLLRGVPMTVQAPGPRGRLITLRLGRPRALYRSVGTGSRLRRHRRDYQRHRPVPDRRQELQIL
jgi:hypothetical protein